MWDYRPDPASRAAPVTVSSTPSSSPHSSSQPHSSAPALSSAPPPRPSPSPRSSLCAQNVLQAKLHPRCATAARPNPSSRPCSLFHRQASTSKAAASDHRKMTREPPSELPAEPTRSSLQYNPPSAPLRRCGSSSRLSEPHYMPNLPNEPAKPHCICQAALYD